jgi:MoaA/NifB/PqqE/SkfB family radical SAM enzyme
MKNIDFLLKERYDIKINIVVSQENLSHIIEMITFFYKKGIKSFFLLFVDYMSDAYVNRKELFLDFFDRDNVKEYLKIINFLDKLRSL